MSYYETPSPLAQLVEHATVNRRVAGSIPAWRGFGICIFLYARLYFTFLKLRYRYMLESWKTDNIRSDN